MKTVLNSSFIFLLLMFCSINFASAQEVFVTKTSNSELVKKTKKSINVTTGIPSHFRHHRKLKPYFSGYAIQITTSDLPLQRDYYLFERFGSVKIDRLSKGGFAYLITGFKSEKATKKFCDLIVRPQAPESKVVRYVKGRMK